MHWLLTRWLLHWLLSHSPLLGHRLLLRRHRLRLRHSRLHRWLLRHLRWHLHLRRHLRNTCRHLHRLLLSLLGHSRVLYVESGNLIVPTTVVLTSIYVEGKSYPLTRLQVKLGNLLLTEHTE